MTDTKWINQTAGPPLKNPVFFHSEKGPWIDIIENFEILYTKPGLLVGKIDKIYTISINGYHKDFTEKQFTNFILKIDPQTPNLSRSAEK